MRALCTLGLACVLLAFAPTPAPASPRARLLLVGDEPQLMRALEVALVPWELEVVRDGAAVAPADLDGAAALAAERDADALVWIDRDGAGGASAPVLHVYDASVGQLTARRLAVALPLDAPAAAAVALTVKTVLRLGTLAPPEERVDAEGPVKPTARAARPPRWRLESGLGLRFAGDDAELRSTVAVDLAPWRGRASLLAGVSLGPGVAVDVPEFAGRHTGTTLRLAARGRLPLGGGGGFGELRAGFALTHATLDGVALADAARAHVVRWNPGLDLGAAAGARLANLEVAVDLGAGWAFRRQRYLLGGEPLYETPALELFLGLRIGVMIQ